MNQCQPRQLKRLYDQREEMLEKLQADYLAAQTLPVDQIPAAVAESASEQPVATYPSGRLIPIIISSRMLNKIPSSISQGDLLFVTNDMNPLLRP
jgi:hypothetical protein